jgi:hypothetical protein
MSAFSILRHQYLTDEHLIAMNFLPTKYFLKHNPVQLLNGAIF